MIHHVKDPGNVLRSLKHYCWKLEGWIQLRNCQNCMCIHFFLMQHKYKKNVLKIYNYSKIYKLTIYVQFYTNFSCSY